MRSINKNKKFVGSVVIKNQEIFINSLNGTGFHKVIEAMEPLVNTLSHFGLSICPWSSFEDIKQNIYILILEGIPKYNPKRGASISTFLYSFIKNGLIDCSRKKDPIKNYYYNEKDISYNINIIEKIDLIKCINKWDDRWRKIMFRVFISNDKIADVSADENMTPWGLTRAIRRKLLEVRK